MNLIAQALIEGGTGKIECPVLAAIARRAECSAGTLYMIARGHKTASAKLSLRIEQATGGKVTRHDLRPDVFGPAEDASQGPATEQPSARAVFGQHQPGIAPAPVPVASSGVSKRALRQRLGFAADAPLAKLLRLPLEQVAAWPDDQPMPALPQVLQLLGRGEEPAGPSARPDPDAGRIVAVEGA